MDFTNKKDWMKEHESGQINECPFCSGENMEHTCRNCYSDIDKETCWKYKSYCQKCFTHIYDEIPKIEAIKNELGIKCKCSEPLCGKCLSTNCKDENCITHTQENKNQWKRRREVGNADNSVVHNQSGT